MKGLIGGVGPPGDMGETGMKGMKGITVCRINNNYNNQSISRAPKELMDQKVTKGVLDLPEKEGKRWLCKL